LMPVFFGKQTWRLTAGGKINDAVEKSYIFESLRPITNVNMRLLRVKPGCDRPKEVKGGHCLPEFTMDSIDKTPFHLQFGDNKTANYFESINVTYEESHEKDQYFRTIEGLNIDYPLGGHQFQFPVLNIVPLILDFAKAVQKFPWDEEVLMQGCRYALKGLFEEHFALPTRAIFIEIAVMAGDMKDPILGNVNVIFEFPPEGGCVPSFRFLPFSYRSLGGQEYFLIALSGCMVLAIMVTAVYRKVKGASLIGGQCVVCIVNHRRSLLKDRDWYSCRGCDAAFDRLQQAVCPQCGAPVQHWEHYCFWKGTILKIQNILYLAQFGLLVVGFSLFSTVSTEVNIYFDKIDAWKALAKDPTVYPPKGNFLRIQNFVQSAYMLAACNVLITFSILYTFITRIPGLSVYLRIFSFGAVQLTTFTLWFSVGFFGYTLALHLVMSTKSKAFATYEDAIVSVFRMLIMEYPFDDLKADDKSFGATVFILWGLLAVIIALNVFIAIICEAYQQAKEHNPDDRMQQSFKLLWQKVTGSVPAEFTKRCRRSVIAQQKRKQLTEKKSTSSGRVWRSPRRCVERLKLKQQSCGKEMCSDSYKTVPFQVGLRLLMASHMTGVTRFDFWFLVVVEPLSALALQRRWVRPVLRLGR